MINLGYLQLPIILSSASTYNSCSERLNILNAPTYTNYTDTRNVNEQAFFVMYCRMCCIM